MSYSISFDIPTDASLEDIFKAADVAIQKGREGFSDGGKQFDYAASVIDESLYFLEKLASEFRPGYPKLRVNISGHANEGTIPTEGWSNDCLTIQVSAVTE